MSNTYNYGSHNDLQPTELFLFIAVEQTCAQLGIDDVAQIGYHTVIRYNGIVSPADRVF